MVSRETFYMFHHGHSLLSDKNGAVTVTTTTLNSCQEENLYGLQFSVEDTGIGMNEEEKARLFHRFEQADSSTTRKQARFSQSLLFGL